MGFDLTALQVAVTRHGRVARVVIADLKGSSPREIGAAMLVWTDGQSGTIGGGALEFAAARAAREVTDRRLTRHPLGPALGQCCGGSVSLLTEIYTTDTLPDVVDDIVARPVEAGRPATLRIKRALADARSQGAAPVPVMLDGWMIEPVHRATRPLWIWGAGHVGRAMVDVLAPLPDFDVTWIDTGRDRFPEAVPDGVTVLPAARPSDLVRHAPPGAEHLIVTYSHALDLELCHQLLSHDFAFAGLIGSKTKWARFRGRLAALGHGDAQIARITCPIGDPALGKHPQMIAIGVAAALLQPADLMDRRKDQTA